MKLWKSPCHAFTSPSCSLREKSSVPIVCKCGEPCKIYETCLNRTLSKLESCINQTLNKVIMQEMFVNWTCINQTPVYSEHKCWSQRGSVQTGFTIFGCDILLKVSLKCIQNEHFVPKWPVWMHFTLFVPLHYSVLNLKY